MYSVVESVSSAGLCYFPAWRGMFILNLAWNSVLFLLPVEDGFEDMDHIDLLEDM